MERLDHYTLKLSRAQQKNRVLTPQHHNTTTPTPPHNDQIAIACLQWWIILDSIQHSIDK